MADRARVVATGSGADAVGSGSATTAILTVPANVAEDDVALVVATWQATALETPPSSTMLGGDGDGWSTLLAPRTDGTMGTAVYAARGFEAGDLIVHQLGASRSVHLLDIYVRDSAPPDFWEPGLQQARTGSSAINTARAMALPEAVDLGFELNLAVSTERTTATPTVVLSSPGASTVAFRETANATNLTSIWFGQLPGTSSPSEDIVITYDDASANGVALQLRAPAAVPDLAPYHPNSELVAVAWLKGIDYLGDRVATELPRDNATIGASGFVVVQLAGGTAPAHVPYRTPVLSVECVAVSEGSGRPPWSKATTMAEAILAATLRHASVPRRVEMPNANYAPAFVRNVRALTEPRRVPGDSGDYARVTLDLAVEWVEIPVML